MTSQLEYKPILSFKVSSNGRWRCKSAAADSRVRVSSHRTEDWGDDVSLPGQLPPAGSLDTEERERCPFHIGVQPTSNGTECSVRIDSGHPRSTPILQPHGCANATDHHVPLPSQASHHTGDKFAQVPQLQADDQDILTRDTANKQSGNDGREEFSAMATEDKQSLNDYSDHSILEIETASSQSVCTPLPSSPAHISSTLLLDSTTLLTNSSAEGGSESHSHGTSPVALLRSIVCLVIVYPILLVCLPLFLTVKVVSLLCCCIPCLKRRSSSTSRFFQATTNGGYYFTFVVLNEKISFEAFVKSIVSSLSEAYGDNNRGVVIKLASRIRRSTCFSWLETGRNTDLDQHIHIVKRQMTTSNDVTYFISELSSQAHEKTWSVYFLSNYRNRSAVVIQTHHSLLTGTELKNKLIELFAHSRRIAFEHVHNDTSLSTDRPSSLSVLAKAPATVLKYLLRRYSSRRVHDYDGKMHFAFSKEISLTRAYHIAKCYGCSLDTVFLACLTMALRKYTQNVKTSNLQNLTFAIPISIGSSVSAYFVELPSNSKLSFSNLVKGLGNQVLSNKGDAFILHSAGRLGSLLLPQCVLNSLTSSVLKPAGGLFTVIDCSRDPLYIEPGISVSSVSAWPPLYGKFGIGVSILCYGSVLRVCVATDRALCEWPDILVSMLLYEYYQITV